MEFFTEYKALETAIRHAGMKAQEIRESGLSITVKGRQDFVSQADIFVEDTLKEAIFSLYPEDCILGEEGGFTSTADEISANSDSGVWVIDPIDGTTNYLQGMDYWCISVAYIVNNVMQLGFIYAPDKDEFFYAKREQGAYLNGRRLHIEEPESGQAIIGLGRSGRRPLQQYLEILQLLDRHEVEYRRFGAGALMLAHVSSGQVNGYFESHLNSWDALAGLLLIQEAGGRVPDYLSNNGVLNGNPVWSASPKLWLKLNDDLDTLAKNYCDFKG